MKTIPLTQGFVALVDDSDFEAVAAFKWHALKRGRRVYAANTARNPNGKRATRYLHKFLMPEVAQVDHRDGDGLNCQRYNLRPATRTQNQQGFQRKKVGASSRFRGVSWNAHNEMFQAEIQVNGKKKYLGGFFVEADAACAYDDAAREHFGDFASPNFL